MLKKFNRFLKNVSFHLIPLGFLFLISLVIIVSWFRYGYLYGGGDVGLPTFDPIRILDIIKNIWWDVHAPGFPYPSALTAIPFSILLAPLQLIGASHVIIQALLFGALLFLSGIGMYFLFFKITVTKSRLMALIAAIFYILNPYIVIQVWHRFVHTAFFLEALIPLLTLIYIKILETNKFSWFSAFLLTSFIFTYAFGSLPFMVVIWIPILIYSFGKCIEVRGSTFKIFRIFILLLLSWILLNFWWLYPFWTTGPAIFSQIHSIYASIATLLSLSAQSTATMVLRGINPFYTFGDSAWVPAYDFPLMQIISWTFPLVVLIGIYTIIKTKNKNLYIWIFLFLLGFLVSKGTAAPFGYPLLWFFSKSFFFGAFRNPFEKIGIIVPFASAFIFPFGIISIYLWLKDRLVRNKKISIAFVVILMILQFGVYAWPMWAGKMFGTYDNPAFVQVPDSYKQADDWISTQQKDGRILQLPFAPGDAVTYFWDKGYSGIEPSALLFKTPSVSQGFGLDQLDNSLGAINTAFTTTGFDKNKVANVLSGLNIKYLIVHKDVDWKSRKLVDPDKLIDLLSQVDFINKRETFGDLIIYEVDDKLFTSKIFTTNISDILIGGDKEFSLWPEIFIDRNVPEVFATPVNGNIKFLELQSDLSFSLTPSQIIDIPPYPLAYKENALAELPRPRILPDSPFYFLILLKEKIQLFSSPILNRHLIELDTAGKRLSEIYQLTLKGNTKAAEKTKKLYMDKLYISLDLINQEMRSGLVNNNDVLNLKRMFARHEIVLNDLNDKEDLDKFKSKLSEMGLTPYFNLRDGDGMNKYGRKVYRFDVPKRGQYEVLLKNIESRGLYKGNLDKISIQVNDKIITQNTRERGDFLSLGQVDLNQGLNEISYNTSDSNNLTPISGSSDWVMNGQVKSANNNNNEIYYELNTNKLDETSLEFPITGFDNRSLYRIDFEYWIKTGQGPILQAEQSSDWDEKGERVMDINKQYDKDNYNFYWNSASILFQPRANTKDAKIKILLKPWNNCVSILASKKICLDKSLSNKYSRESDVVIKSISVKRVLTNDLLLRSPEKGSLINNLNEVVITQFSPSYYEGHLTVDRPISLVFLNSFHPEWKLTLIKDRKETVISESNHFLANGYANLWYLSEKPGEYKIKIEFIPQRRFNNGIKISVIGVLFITMVAYVVFKKRKYD